jgi:hypothetical protein
MSSKYAFTSFSRAPSPSRFHRLPPPVCPFQIFLVFCFGEAHDENNRCAEGFVSAYVAESTPVGHTCNKNYFMFLLFRPKHTQHSLYDIMQHALGLAPLDALTSVPAAFPAANNKGPFKVIDR